MAQHTLTASPECTLVVGELFDDYVVKPTLRRFTPGNGAMHRREAWYCLGERATYFVKFFETGDTGWPPEAAFFDTYASDLDFVVEGRTFTGEGLGPFSHAIVTKEVSGTPLSTLLEDSRGTEHHADLQMKGAQSLSRLHNVAVTGFGSLETGGFEFGSWDDFLSGMAQQRASKRERLLAGGLTDYQIDHALDVILQASGVEVVPVLCHGDPKPAHLIVGEKNNTTLIDFGRVQGNTPYRDCLQYGSFDRVYFDPTVLTGTLLPNPPIASEVLRADALIKVLGLVIYSAKSGDKEHGAVMCHITDRILAGDEALTSPDITSVERFFSGV